MQVKVSTIGAGNNLDYHDPQSGLFLSTVTRTFYDEDDITYRHQEWRVAPGQFAALIKELAARTGTPPCTWRELDQIVFASFGTFDELLSWLQDKRIATS
jgi:hypothetical protein